MESKMTQFAGDFCTLCVYKLGLYTWWLAAVCWCLCWAAGGQSLWWQRLASPAAVGDQTLTHDRHTHCPCACCTPGLPLYIIVHASWALIRERRYGDSDVIRTIESDPTSLTTTSPTPPASSLPRGRDFSLEPAPSSVANAPAEMATFEKSTHARTSWPTRWTESAAPSPRPLKQTHAEVYSSVSQSH